MIDERKLEHIEICLRDEVEARASTGFEDVRLVHEALPELDMSDVDPSWSFLNHELSMPLVIAAMTGGHERAEAINRNLARAAQSVGVALGIGSQRAGLEETDLVSTYSVVREEAPDVLRIANVGGAQLAEDYGIDEAERAVDMIGAGGLAVHLNFTQEAVQPEGDTAAAGLLEGLEELCSGLSVPVLVKETGAGISRETAGRLVEAGVEAIDVSGLGGTSWSAVELHRVRGRDEETGTHLGEVFREWGIPTVQSIVECSGSGAEVMASGGVRSGLDAAKSLALGSDVAGAALPFLGPASRGGEDVERTLQRWGSGLRAAMFLTGSGDVDELKSAPLTVTGKTARALEQRGFEIEMLSRR
ncbi:MAG: Isopentenyl-diphosphate delta-isomerase [Methanonatronarchaeales archaeon]|nr:Isopentenyl-diphosphate delta-isomerase [Methanonatronarchaeales archaeon]